MPATLQITDTVKLTVLKHLANGRDRQFVATACGITADQVLEIASKHGWPDRDKISWAVDVLTGKGITPTPQTAPTPAALPRPAAPTPAAGRPATRSAGELVDVHPSELTPDPNNPRDDLQGIDDLAQSLVSAGMLQPIVARQHNGQLLVVAGHRRLAAAISLGWDTVPVIVRADMRPDAVLAAMLIENGQRTDLDPVEEARALRRLKTEMGNCSHAELGRRVGRTQVHVSARLAILSLPVEEQEMLRAGQMNVGDAVRRGRLHSGNVRPTGSTGHPHLGIDHDLAARARARCQRLGHANKGRNSVGGVACGECWESVIRADERDHLHDHSASTGRCALCETPLEKTAVGA